MRTAPVTALHVPRLTLPVFVAGVILCAGCTGRYVRMDQKGLPCGEAHQLAIAAVRRMNYTIDSVSKPTPGTPGVITATRTDGTSKHGLLVQVFCTMLGTEIEAKTDQGGLAQINFPQEFKRNFEAVATQRVPQRAAAESGLDVLVTPARGNTPELGVDLSGIGVMPVTVRISNRSPRTYHFRAKDVVLQTADGERVKPLPVQDVAKQVDAAAAEKVQQKLLTDRDIQPNDTVTGFLFFPFKPYARARVVLKDQESGEPEGFSIEF